MNKVPVWRTIGSAYGFTFGNLATIIGLIWLPLVLLFVGEYFAISRYLDSVLTALANGNRYAIYRGAGYLYLYRLGALFLQATIAVPVMRQALGLRKSGAIVHFEFGITQLRLFGALVAYFLIVLTIEIAGLAVLIALFAGLNFIGRNLGEIHGVSALFVARCADLGILVVFSAALLFVVLRLSFLLVAVTVAENRIDLIRAWTLTHGNFWRIVVVWTAITLPAWFLYLAIQIAFVGFAAYAEAIHILPNVGQFAGNVRIAALQMHRVLAWLPYVYAAWLLVQPLALGLASGAAARAYRALVPLDAAVSTPLADSPLPAATS